MAINPETQYPGKITASSANYPYGQARNITVPGDGTGTPWEAALVNDIFGMQQALLSEAGITPTGNPETAVASQYLNAMHTLNPRVFDTYDTDLAAYTPLGDEQVVYCKGKASVGDGGAGFFRYDLASTTWIPAYGYDSKNSFKNKFINPWFDYWQRGGELGGTAINVTADDTYTADRMVLIFDGTADVDVEQVALGTPIKIGNRWVVNGLKITVNTNSGNTYLRLCQRIEYVTSLVDHAAVLNSFIQGSGNLTVPVYARQNFGTGGSSDVVTGFSSDLSVTSSMQELQTGVVIPDVSGKTIVDIDSFLSIEYDLINLASTDYIIIPFHQFELGGVESLPEYRNPDIEIQALNRFAFTIDPNKFGAASITIASGVVVGATNPTAYMGLQSPMRATPTATLLSGAVASVNNGGAGIGITGINVSNSDDHHLSIQAVGAAGLTTGNGVIFILTGGALLFNAEL